MSRSQRESMDGPPSNIRLEKHAPSPGPRRTDEVILVGIARLSTAVEAGLTERRLCFVDVAPGPSRRWHRAHDRMVRRVEMLGRVLAGRLIAASDMATHQAHPQMEPVTMRL